MPRAFGLKEYRFLLRQYARARARPALVLGWTRDGLLDWPSALGRVDRILASMTQDERDRPEILDEAARSRIATESGAALDEVENLVRRFLITRDRVRMFESLSLWQRLRQLICWR